MTGKIRNFCEYMVRVMFRSYKVFLNSKYGELLIYVPYGKGDTLALDAIPEICYIEELRRYNPEAIFVTEETDEITLQELPDDANPKIQPTTLVSDPIDRSKFMVLYLEALFKKHKSKNKDVEPELLTCVSIKELFDKYGSFAIWNKISGAPAEVTGANSSITCVRNGKVVFTIIANYITGSFFIACDAGIFNINLSKVENEQDIDLEMMLKKENHLNFPNIKSNNSPCFVDLKRFTTFLGKDGYRENFNDSMIFMAKDDINKYLHYDEPGGPSRVLYLSELQDTNNPLGFIMYNGEKITEWIHALSFVKYARNNNGNRVFNVFEISTKRPWIKEDILMSTPPTYSIFNKRNGNHYIDINMLKIYKSPSHYRSMLVIAPKGNDWIHHKMRQHKYRDISDCL